MLILALMGVRPGVLKIGANLQYFFICNNFCLKGKENVLWSAVIQKFFIRKISFTATVAKQQNPKRTPEY